MIRSIYMVGFACLAPLSHAQAQPERIPFVVEEKVDTINDFLLPCHSSDPTAFVRKVFWVNGSRLAFYLFPVDRGSRKIGARCSGYEVQGMRCYGIYSKKGKLSDAQLINENTGQLVESRCYYQGRLYERMSYQLLIKGDCPWVEYWQYSKDGCDGHGYFTFKPGGRLCYSASPCAITQ